MNFNVVTVREQGAKRDNRDAETQRQQGEARTTERCADKRDNRDEETQGQQREARTTERKITKKI